jgi:hypothetical protein
MRSHQNRKFLSIFAATACVGLFVAPQAQAADISWSHSVDAFNDSTGGHVYELHGLAVGEDNNNVYVGINGNMPLAGNRETRAWDNNIGFGDFFLNFSGQQYGINFAEKNDSDVAQTGVYGNIEGKNVTRGNAGYRNAKHYTRYARNETLGSGMSGDTFEEQIHNLNKDGTAATSGSNYDWGNYRQEMNVMKSGDRLGNINFLQGTQLDSLTASFNDRGVKGSETIGFGFSKDLLPNEVLASGGFISHVWLECLNDGIALEGQLSPKVSSANASVPETGGAASMALLGLAFSGLPMLRRRSS